MRIKLLIYLSHMIFRLFRSGSCRLRTPRKSPLTPLFQRGETKLFSSFSKGGIALVLFISLLTGCTQFVENTSAVGQAAQNQGLNIITYADVTQRVYRKLTADPSLKKGTHLVVSTYQGEVLLTGQVMLPKQRMQVERLARSVPGVGQVFNEITIAGPSSPLTRSSDAWITGKVKSQMLLTRELRSTEFKVVTETGTVFLLGNVSHRQAEMATEVARTVTGVQKVVKLFSYTD